MRNNILIIADNDEFFLFDTENCKGLPLPQETANLLNLINDDDIIAFDEEIINSDFTPSEELTARLFFMGSQSLQSFLDNEPDYFS